MGSATIVISRARTRVSLQKACHWTTVLDERATYIINGADWVSIAQHRTGKTSGESMWRDPRVG